MPKRTYLPRTSNQPETVKPENIRLYVDAWGAYYWNDASISDTELQAPIAGYLGKQSVAGVPHPGRQGRPL